jgi:anti-sigma B factor antagonist
MAPTSIQPYSLTVYHGGGPYSVTVAARGELDLAAAGPLRQLLEQQRRAGHRHVRVDTSDVTFVDATALGVIADAHQQFIDRHGTLTLTGAGPRIQRLLRITGLDRVLFVAGPRAHVPASVA